MNKAFTQRYTTLLLKVLLLVLGVYAYSFWNYVRFLTKETPKKTLTKLSRVLLHVLRPPGVVYVQTSVCAFGRCLVQKSHEPLRSSNSSTFSEVLSLLSFTSPLDPLRSRVAPFTFFNRYTFVTHTRYTSYLHIVHRSYLQCLYTLQIT